MSKEIADRSLLILIIFTFCGPFQHLVAIQTYMDVFLTLELISSKLCWQPKCLCPRGWASLHPCAIISMHVEMGMWEDKWHNKDGNNRLVQLGCLQIKEGPQGTCSRPWHLILHSRYRNAVVGWIKKLRGFFFSVPKQSRKRDKNECEERQTKSWVPVMPSGLLLQGCGEWHGAREMCRYFQHIFFII